MYFRAVKLFLNIAVNSELFSRNVFIEGFLTDHTEVTYHLPHQGVDAAGKNVTLWHEQMTQTGRGVSYKDTVFLQTDLHNLILTCFLTADTMLQEQKE